MTKKAQAGLKELPAEPPTFADVAREQREAEEQATLAAPPPGEPSKYRVSLNCPTPLAHKTLEVEAASEQEARQKFCDANGISDSRHDWTVIRVS